MIATLTRTARRVTMSGERQVLVLQGNVALWTRWQDGHPVAERIERLDRDEKAATRSPWSIAPIVIEPTGAASQPMGLPVVQSVVKPVCRDDDAIPDGDTADGAGDTETFVEVVADSPLDDIERVLTQVDDLRGRGAEIGRTPRTSRANVPGVVARWLLGRRLARHHRTADVRSAPVELAPLLAVMLRSELPEEWSRRLEILQRGGVTVRVLHSAIRLRTPAEGERQGDVLRVIRGGGTMRHLLYRAGCPTFTRVVTPGSGAAAETALEETRAHLLARHGVVGPRTVLDTARPDVDDGGAHGSVEPDVVDARRLAQLVVAARPGARSGVMSALTDKWRRHVELRRLHVATALTAMIAGLTVVVSVVHGIDSTRRRTRAISAGEALVARFETLSEVVDARHPAPALAEASLALIERRRETSAPDATELLGSLAAVLSAHPPVTLDRLAWSSDLVPEPAGDSPLDTPSSLPLRTLDDGTRPDTRLEIAGRIDLSGSSKGSVRERQVRFEAFVDALERESSFGALDVRVSPATAAASGGYGARPFGGDGQGIDYELRLRRADEGGAR